VAVIIHRMRPLLPRDDVAKHRASVMSRAAGGGKASGRGVVYQTRRNAHGLRPALRHVLDRVLAHPFVPAVLARLLMLLDELPNLAIRVDLDPDFRLNNLIAAMMLGMVTA